MRGPRGAVPGLGDDLDINLVSATTGQRVDQAVQRGQVGHFGGICRSAEAAVEIEKVDAFRQRAAALAFHILADFVFDGVQNAVAVLAFDVQRESFLHGRW